MSGAAKRPDPVTKLTDAEKKFINDTVANWTHEEIRTKLKRDLQIAVQIELATIPVYLYGYYSIQRDEKSGENIRPIDLYANKAGGLIMSVAVEEMLHMSLSANVYFAMFGQPAQLYRKSPPSFPTPLPYHNPKGPPGPEGEKDAQVLIPLAKFSYEQLWHFLQIEYPEQPSAAPKDMNWDSIGQFYSYIRCLISAGKVLPNNPEMLTDADFQHGHWQYQIQPYNYSPNNVDTTYPKKKFDPWENPSEKNSASAVAQYADAPDSHTGPTELITVYSIETALEAIDTICDQGEGYPIIKHSKMKGQKPTDDPSKKEDSHYYKFLSLQAQMESYEHHKEHLPKSPPPPDAIQPTVTDEELAKVVLNFPDNPTSAGYYVTHLETGYVNLRPFSDLVNGVYQYMLILTETIFKIPGPEDDLPEEKQPQKIFFNKAMHNTMIWILDKLVRTMRNFELGDGHVLGPTFEDIDLGPRQEAYASLMNLCSAVKDMPYYGHISYYVERIENTVPNVSEYWASAPGPGDPGEPVPKPYPYKDAPKFPTTIGPQPKGLPLHGCMGLNCCKGADRFGVDGPPGGTGPNDCAGQGYCATTADHTCHTKNECRNQGGCGLYGNNREFSQPGVNDCQSLGSCATPINAERFITTGEYRGKSVWKRAREVFEKGGMVEGVKVPALYSALRKQLKHDGVDAKLPAQLGKPPFADGPPYLWISDDNQQRGNMTACGASGMSGAGGCA